MEKGMTQEELAFQSLFLWNIYFNSIQEIGHIYRPVFQSLFLWNIYFNFGQPNLLVVVRICFNPYFYGTSTSTSTAEEAEKRKKECFNPYFYGTSTSTNTRH